MIGWCIQTLTAMTAMMLLAICMRALFRGRINASLGCAVWLLPFLRLALPSLPILPSKSAFVLEHTGTSRQVFLQQILAVNWLQIAVLLWLFIALVFFGFNIWHYLSFVRGVRSNVVGRFSIHGRVRVQYSTAVDSPVAVGIFQKEIFLPVDFDDRFTVLERRLALTHELMHHRRQDILWNLAALLVLAVHWFNPIAYLSYRMFRQDQELACDAAVLAVAGKGRKAAYGRTLVKASNSSRLILCALSDKATLKLRLQKLAAGSVFQSRRLACGLIACASICLVLSAAVRCRVAEKNTEMAILSEADLGQRPSPTAITSSEATSSTTLRRKSMAHRSKYSPAVPSSYLPVRVESPEVSADSGDAGTFSIGGRDDAASEAIGRAAMRGHPVGDPVYLAYRRVLAMGRHRTSDQQY